jgi:hypothetical protein
MIECLVIKTVVKIKVGPGVTHQQAKELNTKLEDAWDDNMDEEESVYRALDQYLIAAGVTGDYNIEPPEYLFYDANGRPIG